MSENTEREWTPPIMLGAGFFEIDTIPDGEGDLEVYSRDGDHVAYLDTTDQLTLRDLLNRLHPLGPRTITTAEELDALVLPAIIDSPNGGPAKVEYYAGPGRQKYVERLFCGDDGDDESYSLAFFATFGLPAQVLKEGIR